jgi:RNA polymerase sigma-70 factor (ECF subfamily)
MLGTLLLFFPMPVSKEEFTRVYIENRSFMFGVANRILHNQKNAEDAVGEAFLRIAKKWGKENFDFSSKSCEEIRGLCGIISRGCAIDIYRRERNNVVHISEENGDFSEISAPDDLVDKVISNAGYEALVGEISQMKDIYKDALRLKLIYGYSLGEIADLLHITKRTAEMRVFRGRQKLIESLREE